MNESTNSSKNQKVPTDEVSTVESWLQFLQTKLKERKLQPIVVQWFCTNQCNFKCIHCGSDSAEAEKDELSTSEIMPVIKDLSELGCKIFGPTGGEPLVRKDVFQVLQYAKDLGMHIGLVTNGYLVEKYKNELSKLELASVLVSIDGYRSTHDKIRGVKGAYTHALKSLEIFRDLGVPIVGVSTVILNENITSIPNIVDDVMKHGCTRYRVQAVVPEGRARGYRYKPGVLETVLKFILDKRKEGLPVECDEGIGYLGPLEEKVRGYRFFCQVGYSTLTILANGDIIGCSALDHPEACEGNIRTENIKDIWWNKFQQFRDKKRWYESLPKKCKECKHLKACRGSCWVHRITGEYCFLPVAEKVAKDYGIT